MDNFVESSSAMRSNIGYLLNFVIVGIKSAACITAKVGVAVPYLQTAASIAEHLMKMVQKVQKNKENAQLLAERCIRLTKNLEIINSHGVKKQEEIDIMVKELIGLLQKVEMKLNKWENTSWIMHFFKQDDITEYINKFEKKINSIVESHQINVGHELMQAHVEHVNQIQTKHVEQTVQIQTNYNELVVKMQTDKEDLASRISRIQEITEDTAPKIEKVVTQLSTLQECIKVTAQNSNLKIAEKILSSTWETKSYLWEDLILAPISKSCSVSEKYLIREGSCPDHNACVIKHLTDPKSISMKRFERQIDVWKKACEADSDGHILPLIGYVMQDMSGSNPILCTITPWMKNDNAANFFSRRNVTTDKLKFILKLAKGVAFLHSLGLIHGYLRGNIIIVNAMEEPLIGDFGLSRPDEEPELNMSSLPQDRGFMRWVPREMIVHDDCIECFISPKADVFMFGMTVLEIMTGNIPFADIHNNLHIFKQRIDGNYLPKRPDAKEAKGLNDGLWNLLMRCWALDPAIRPTMQDIVCDLETLQREEIM